MQISDSLTPEQLNCLPTETDIVFYEEHGWYISPPILSEKIIDQAISGTERYYRGERDFPLPVQQGYSDWRPEDGDGVRNNEFVSLQNREIQALVKQPIIGAIAARLARTQQVRLLDDQLIYKPSLDQGRESAVGWHCDRAYWSSCTSDRLLTAWIPLQDCRQASGPLIVMDRSHRWPGQENLRAFNQKNLDSYSDQFRQEGRQVEIVPMLLKKGQVSFHHCWTVHGSYPNQSKEPRLALAVHLQDGDNQYRPFKTQQGKEVHMFDEQLCRKLPNGYPDFSDPQIFPVLWRESSAE